MRQDLGETQQQTTFQHWLSEIGGNTQNGSGRASRELGAEAGEQEEGSLYVPTVALKNFFFLQSLFNQLLEFSDSGRFLLWCGSQQRQ